MTRLYVNPPTVAEIARDNTDRLDRLGIPYEINATGRVLDRCDLERQGRVQR